uniref:Amino-acid permease BAT1 n=2 Tax=Zea mays TaxID=4577 RepID=A0A804NHU9_MAIZE
MEAQNGYSPLLAGDDHEAIHATGAGDEGDDVKLRLLGYKQQLKRDLSVVANFSVSFSIVSVVTGVTTLFGTGLQFGGPATMVYGWPIAGAFTAAVGLAMAEICSAYPTSGGLYFWSARLCTHRRWGPFAAWLTGWFNVVGQWAVTTSVDYSLAQLIQVIILLATGGKNGGGYLASKYMVIGFHAAILLSHAVINSLPITFLSFFGQFAAAWNMLGVFVLMVAVPTVATERASAEFVFTHFNTDNGAGIRSNLYIFVLGLLMSQYTLTGYDASAHMTEETKNADKNGPIGIISAIGISILVGWGYILGVTFAVKDIPYLLSPDNDAGGYAIAEVFYLAFKSRYGSGAGGIVCLGVVAVAVYFCGMSSVTSNSRMAYAFSRDGAMPFSSVWHKVNKQEVPINAVWLSALVALCMALPVYVNFGFFFLPHTHEGFGSLVSSVIHVNPRTIYAVSGKPGGVPGHGFHRDDRAVHLVRAADPVPGDAGAQVLRAGAIQPGPLRRPGRLGRRALGGHHHRALLAAGHVPGHQGHAQLHPRRRRRPPLPRPRVLAAQRQALVQGPRHQSGRMNMYNWTCIVERLAETEELLPTTCCNYFVPKIN